MTHDPSKGCISRVSAVRLYFRKQGVKVTRLKLSREHMLELVHCDEMDHLRRFDFVDDLVKGKAFLLGVNIVIKGGSHDTKKLSK